MASLRLVLPASTLLMLGLCWPVIAYPTKEMAFPGFVTNYVMPMANLSLDKLVGRWYLAELMSFPSPENITAFSCFVYDFHYDDNDTLMAETIMIFEGQPALPLYSYPVTENGVWDVILFGVPVSSHAVVHVDDRFLAVVSCMNRGLMDCKALVLVRHAADADRPGELGNLHHQLAQAGVNPTDGGFVKVIEPCRSAITAAPDLSAQNGPSTRSSE